MHCEIPIEDTKDDLSQINQDISLFSMQHAEIFITRPEFRSLYKSGEINTTPEGKIWRSDLMPMIARDHKNVSQNRTPTYVPKCLIPKRSNGQIFVRTPGGFCPEWSWPSTPKRVPDYHIRKFLHFLSCWGRKKAIFWLGTVGNSIWNVFRADHK
jgi:hypothetical protein